MLTLARAVDLFLGEQIPSTRKSYMYVLFAMRDYVGPARPLDTIAAEYLLEHMQAIRQRPDVKSNATVNKHVKTIRTFFNWCVNQGFITSSPAKGLRYRRHSEAIPREKAMPDYLYERLVDYAQWHPRFYALVLFLGDTGCRIGGAAGLRWNDVDFNQSMAVVTEKGKPPREVFFGKECRAVLLRWREHHPMTRGDFVFSAKGQRILNDNLGQFFRRHCDVAGIGSWGPHSLRHRKGHQLADARVAPSVAARALGDTVEVTMKYYYPDDLERVKEAMQDLAYRDAPTPASQSKIKRFGS